MRDLYMTRGGMRISEVLKLTPSDINERRLTLRHPKSGREQEFIFIPQRLADRLKDYIRESGIQSHQRIFPICYEAAREMVAKAGSVVGIHLRPHMILGAMQPPMQVAPVCPLRSFRRSYYDIRIFQRLSDILGK